MTGPVYELPASIELPREDYRLINAALEAALDVFDRSDDTDPDDRARHIVERALSMLARRIWPELGSLDEEE
jgi:hypothetical protein